MEAEKKDEIIEDNISPKKRIITSYDKNNEAYYSELNSREPTTFCQSVDYYELLKQQIKYYKELNSSLKDEIETVKHCKRLKELEKMDEINKLVLSNNIKEKDEINNTSIEKKLNLSDLKKEYHINMINTLDRFNKDKDKEEDLNNSQNSEEKYLTLKKEMKILEEENQSLKKSLEQLNNMKYPDEENNSYLYNQINISKDNEENTTSIDLSNKLLLDNNRLKIYIEKIEQMQKLLNRYESQINSLSEELRQKNEKMKILIYKIKSPNKNDINVNDDSDLVNIDINNIYNEKQLDELNEVKKERDMLKIENEKLNSVLNKKKKRKI